MIYKKHKRNKQFITINVILNYGAYSNDKILILLLKFKLVINSNK
jgi:hypothetical protein